MKILWVDPLNTHPQGLNVMSAILRDAGHDVRVRSIARDGHLPPPDVHWAPFMRFGRPVSSLKGSAFTTLRVLGSYPLCWHRAVRWAHASGVKALLVTTHLTLWRWDTWALRLMARRGLAPVVIVHKPYRGIFDDPAGKRAARYRAFYRSAARVLTFNAFTRELMRTLSQLPEERHCHLPFPHFQPLLDRFPTDRELVRRLHEWAAGAPVIAFLSNMRPEQGLDDLLSGLAVLDAELADWRLLLVSTGGGKSANRAVQRRLVELGLRERCWCRWDTYSYSSLKAYLEAASLVVAPYRWATQSGVVAMATGAGVPVVATTVGGLPEMVRHGVNGELVPAGDPDRLARAVARVLGHLEHYRHGARTCRDALYSPRRTADAIEGALRAASGERAPPGRIPELQKRLPRSATGRTDTGSGRCETG